MTIADEERKAQLERDWANVLARPEGRRVVWDILSQCGVMRSSYRGNADTNFLEGQRHVGLWMLAERMTPVDPRLFSDMIAENLEWEASLEALEQDSK